MAVEADVFLPISVTILYDGVYTPHALERDIFLPGTVAEFFFTTPLTPWFDPATGDSRMPYVTCRGCGRRRILFQMMYLEQPEQPGTIFFGQAPYCLTCVPRTCVHLVVTYTDKKSRANKKSQTEQTIRFRAMHYDDGSLVQVRDQMTKAVGSIEDLQFRLIEPKEFIFGRHSRLKGITQPYDDRATSMKKLGLRPGPVP